MYEYGIVFEVADMTPEILATATKDEFSQNLGAALNKVITRVPERIKTFQGGDWEITSHQLTRFDHYLVISFLLRRPK